MIILMTAALAAAHPAPAPAVSYSAAPHAQHQVMGHMGTMNAKQMAECQKCCEEMMAKMHDGHLKHDEHTAQ